MYIVRTDTVVPSQGAGAFEEWFAGLGPIFKASKGFQIGGLMRSPGAPSSYSSLVRFGDRASLQEMMHGQAFVDHVRARANIGVGAPTRQEIYELVSRAGDPAQAAGFGAIALVEWQVLPGAADAFQASRQEVFELRQKVQKGFVANSLWRYLGNPTSYMIAQASTDLDALRGKQPPEVASFMRAHPYTEYATTPPTIEYFEMVVNLTA